MPPRVVVISDLPPACPVNGQLFMLQVSGACFVAYDLPEEAGSVALVRFDRVLFAAGPGPNDEGLGGHPCFSLGVRWFDLQEVIDSPWIEKIARLQHKDREATFAKGQRHFVFAFKENSVDIIANRYALVGLFPTRILALTHALQISAQAQLL